MPAHTPEHAEHNSEQNHGDDHTTLHPPRRSRSSTQDKWHVERIDTEPMTAQQPDLAVTTLATLITQWNNNNANNANTNAAPEKAA